MALRSNIELEMRPLLKALRARIDALTHTSSVKDKLEIFVRGDVPFLQLEIRRDHLLLDLWLPPAKLEEARSSGIGRAHPFMGHEAVKVRFERAEDLTRVARWLEDSYRYASERTLSAPGTPADAAAVAAEAESEAEALGEEPDKKPAPAKKSSKKK
jgi:hypothetical protein